MFYKKLVTLSLVGILSFGVLVGCESENQEVKELEQQTTEQKKETTNNEETTENEVTKEYLKKEEMLQEKNDDEEVITVKRNASGSRLCVKCDLEIEEGNNTSLCDHCRLYDNCDDCGKEKLKDDLKYDGKYHCGCTEVTFDCAYCGKLTYGHQAVAASYCSQECLDTATQKEYSKEEGNSICIGCGRHFVGSQTGYCDAYECVKKSDAALQEDYIEMLKENAMYGDNNAMLELANQGICPYCFSHNTLQTFSPDSLTCYDCGSFY